MIERRKGIGRNYQLRVSLAAPTLNYMNRRHYQRLLRGITSLSHVVMPAECAKPQDSTNLGFGSATRW